MTSVFSWQNSISLCPSILQGKMCLLLQVFLDIAALVILKKTISMYLCINQDSSGKQNSQGIFIYFLKEFTHIVTKPRSPLIYYCKMENQGANDVIQSESEGFRTRSSDVQGQEKVTIPAQEEREFVLQFFLFEPTLVRIDSVY